MKNDGKLKEHIASNFIQEAPEGITLNIMSRIELEKETVHGHLIGKKVRIVIAAFFVTLLALPFFIGSESNSLPDYYQWINVSELENTLAYATEIIIGTVSVFVLLILDNMYRKNRKLAL